MTDPTGGQLSEEEIRAYLTQIRDADPAAIVVQAYRLLGEAAELKLGRTDARLLIDAMAAITQTADGRVDSQLVQQMRDGVGQLQMAQVQAERQAASGPEATKGAESGEPAQPSTQPPPGQAASASGGQQAGEKPITDRLWIPGRGPAT